MPALNRTVALVQVDYVAMLVTKDLHLDVFGARDVFLKEYCWIAKGAARLGLRFVEQVREIARLVHDPHSASAAAFAALDCFRRAVHLNPSMEDVRAQVDYLERQLEGK
jgi:hypothetical protein